MSLTPFADTSNYFEKMEIKELYKQLLDETVAHYNSKNRAVFNGGCRYSIDDGRKCAIGRIMTEKVRQYMLYDPYNVE